MQKTPNEPRTPSKSQQASRIIEIHSGKKKESVGRFKQSESFAQLQPKQVTASLVKSFNRGSGRLRTEATEKAIQEFAKDKKEEAETLFNEQAKIFNKILWVRILTERIVEDNQVERLEFHSRQNKERQNRLGKMKQEAFKTSNYLEIVEK